MGVQSSTDITHTMRLPLLLSFLSLLMSLTNCLPTLPRLSSLEDIKHGLLDSLPKLASTTTDTQIHKTPINQKSPVENPLPTGDSTVWTPILPPDFPKSNFEFGNSLDDNREDGESSEDRLYREDVIRKQLHGKKMRI